MIVSTFHTVAEQLSRRLADNDIALDEAEIEKLDRVLNFTMEVLQQHMSGDESKQEPLKARWLFQIPEDGQVRLSRVAGSTDDRPSSESARAEVERELLLKLIKPRTTQKLHTPDEPPRYRDDAQRIGEEIRRNLFGRAPGLARDKRRDWQLILLERFAGYRAAVPKHIAKKWEK